MGVYPMLPDETCWFRAVYFDKSTWKEDVRAFAERARRLGLPVRARAPAIGQRRPRVVLFLGARARVDCAQDGLPCDHGDDDVES